MTTAVGARLSTTSEGLWLTAALAGVSRLPSVLKVRPVGDVANTVATHPGMAVLEEAGVCSGAVLDSDVADWLLTLGRPDVELAITVSRPEGNPDRFVGPPPLFEAPEDDPLAAYEALEQWRSRQGAQRAAALCRREGRWVAAARVWRTGEAPLDEIVVSPLADGAVAAAIGALAGRAQPADFDGINIESAVLESLAAQWQARPGMDVVAALTDAGLTVPQARIVAAVGDASAARTVVVAAQYSIDGAQFAPTGITIVDTLLGRVIISNLAGNGEPRWTMLFPGTAQRVARAVGELLQGLPSGSAWTTHERIQKFDTR
ncbi:MAG: hypothetical protein JWR37_2420 [Mycobacterium sp.]|nr:hypothetical protein [Mycobacterium sp.]